LITLDRQTTLAKLNSYNSHSGRPISVKEIYTLTVVQLGVIAAISALCGKGIRFARIYSGIITIDGSFTLDNVRNSDVSSK